MIHCHDCGKLLALGDVVPIKGTPSYEPSGFTFEAVIIQPVSDGWIAACDGPDCARATLCDTVDGKLVPKVRKPADHSRADFGPVHAPELPADAVARLKRERPDAGATVRSIDPAAFDAEEIPVVVPDTVDVKAETRKRERPVEIRNKSRRGKKDGTA